MANIIERTKSAIEAFRGRTAPSGKGAAFASFQERIANMLRVSHERTQIHKDLERMDKTDEIVKFAHDAYANRSTGMEDPTLDVFQVTVEPNKQGANPASESTANRAQEEIQALIERTNLRREIWQIARRTVKHGNEFRELAIDWDTFEIMELRLRPEHTMWPLVNDKGDRIPGFEQRLEHGIGEPIRFKEGEIIHWAFGELDGYLGTPLLGCARKNWRRLNMAEDATFLGRLFKMCARFIHRVPVNPNDSPADKQKAIDAYKDAMTKLAVFNSESTSIEKWEMPETVNTNFFIPDDGSNRGGVDMHDPQNAQLQHLADLEYGLNRLITATGIPKRYFPFEGATPKLSEGGGSAEDKHFACTIMFLQMVLKAGMKELFDRQLLLKGIDPRTVRYVIRMADISTTDQFRRAQKQLTLAKAMEILLKEYPEAREHIAVILREFSDISDASFDVLSKVEVEEKPEPTTALPDDDRAQLPGAGAGPEARTKV
jgi:hypothetical protein